MWWLFSSSSRHGHDLNRVRASQHQVPRYQWYTGIRNDGNTCYINATLQAIASTSFLEHLIEFRVDELNDADFPYLKVLYDVLTRLRNPKSYRDVIVLPSLLQNLLKDSFYQQDAQEYFQVLMERVSDELASLKRTRLTRGLNSLTSPPRLTNVFNPFQMMQSSCVTCRVCSFTSTLQTCSMTSLPVPLLSSSCSLQTCLQAMMTPENISDCVCEKCTVLKAHETVSDEIETLEELLTVSPSNDLLTSLHRLQSHQTLLLSQLSTSSFKTTSLKPTISPSIKQTWLCRLPRLLTFFLSRSLFSTYAYKNSTHVIFRPTLIMDPYLLPSRHIGSLDPVMVPPDLILTNASAAYLDAVHRRQEENGREMFRLSAVMCHFGSTEYGHYVTYRYGGDGDKWVRISDDDVVVVSVVDVLKQSASAYMLFYEKM